MKIKDLSPELFEQLVELESTNIIPILASVGINLTPQHMRDQLIHFKESPVVLYQDPTTDHVEGFAMYEIKETELKVISFNLRKFNNFKILASLLKQIFHNLQSVEILNIKSRAHVTNIKSLNFHRKMGFKEVGKTDQFVEFQIAKDELLSTIERRIRVPQ